MRTLLRTVRHLIPAVVAAGVAIAPAPQPALAQGLFSPAILVNDDMITNFELQQRTRMMRLLRIPGKPEELAREALIEDRLKQQAVASAGITVAPEDIEAGIEELAARTQLSGEEFVQALEEGGVAYETIRDFAEVSLAWRDLVRARFLARARPTDAEIDLALGYAGSGGGISVLLSELIIPVTPQTLDEAMELAEEISQITSFEEFSEAATQYSATETRAKGGRMDWLAINNLPPGLRPILLALAPGEVTAPISLPDAVALFQMRGIRENSSARLRYSAIEYATYYIPGGRSEAALATASAIRDRVDTCDDLYGIARGQPEQVLERASVKPGDIPRDIALELAKLDEGEVSIALTRSEGQVLMLLMLCGRTAEPNEDTTREDIAAALSQQRLIAFSESYLEQLRADALIIDK